MSKITKMIKAATEAFTQGMTRTKTIETGGYDSFAEIWLERLCKAATDSPTEFYGSGVSIPPWTVSSDPIYDLKKAEIAVAMQKIAGPTMEIYEGGTCICMRHVPVTAEVDEVQALQDGQSVNEWIDEQERKPVIDDGNSLWELNTPDATSTDAE